jgi:transcriptional regulator with XRE-family HTH domain
MPERRKIMSTFDLGRRARLARGLKAARFRAKFPAKQAAMLLTSMGLSCQRGTLLAWERGRGTTSREPYASDLPVIAAVYGCSVDDLFGEPMIEMGSVNGSANGVEARAGSIGAVGNGVAVMR